MSTFRGFIAVEIPSNKKIQDLENAITQTQANVKLVELHNIHITLKFLGDVPDHQTDSIEKIMVSSVQNMKTFQLTLGNTGVFPNTNYMKILWIGIQDNNTLSAIASALEKGLEPLGFPKEKRTFSPHLTLGRVRTAEHKDKLIAVLERYAHEQFGEYTINAIQLKKSDLTPKGPIYTTIKTVKFSEG